MGLIMNESAKNNQSIERLKELARVHKKETGCAHNEALEIVAKQHGFQTWHQATKELPLKSQSKTDKRTKASDTRTVREFIDSLPKSTDEELNRLSEALFHDKPKTDYLDLPPDEAMKMALKEMESFPGGHTAYTVDHVTKTAILNMIMNSRRAGQLSDEDFDDLVDEVRTAQGRKNLLDRVERAYAMERKIAGQKASTKTSPAPHFRSTNTELDGFKFGVPKKNGSMVGQFIAMDSVEDYVKDQVTRSPAFEFSWGFIKSSNNNTIWDFYVKDVWESGTENFFDRFLTAWKNDGEPELEKARMKSDNNFFISMDDGISNFSCISLACLGDEHSVSRARKWISDEFIARIFPVMVAKVLDLNYKFAEDWYNS